MNNSVIIKGSKDGLTILVNEDMRYDELIGVLKEKFAESRSFFKKASMALAIKGIELTECQEREIIDVIETYSEMKIICLVDDSEVNNARFYRAMKEKEYLERTRTGQFVRGTLHKGQIFESPVSVIVLGDVNPGAKVISGGNIIVMGELGGYAFAGADNDNKCFIAALNMNSCQIKINNVSARCTEKFRFLRRKGPKIAYLCNDGMCIDTLDRTELNTIL
ncbi:MAG: septum site-determining protein MinC [Thermoflexaceae bacterium]|nr:septum site-determining protein MinC [Thermoflexaceae bacterium]